MQTEDSGTSPKKETPPEKARSLSTVHESGNGEVIKLKSVRATIVLIERQALIRNCLSYCISAEIEAPVTSFSDVESWQEISSDMCPGLIVVSASHESKEWIERAILQLRRAGETAPIVVLSDSNDIDDIADALQCGASGCVPWGTPLEVAIEAIRLVLAGGVFVPGDALLRLGREQRRIGGSSAKRITFSARQKAVLIGLCQGKTNRLIACELEIGENTVKSHVHKIMKKLGLKKRADVVTRIGGDVELFD